MIRQRVPGASLPRTRSVVGPVDATGADPAAARVLVEQFQAGARRAEQGPVEPTPERPRLSRRVPGANLTVTPPPAPPTSPHPGDPTEVRDLITEFEAGVARALREVSPDHRYEEDPTR